MEEREVRKYYSELQQSFLPENTKPIEQTVRKMEQTLTGMVTLVDEYEKARAQDLSQFKNELIGIVNEFWNGPFAEQLEHIKETRELANERWKEIQPRMQDLAQIKQILRRFSGRRQ